MLNPFQTYYNHFHHSFLQHPTLVNVMEIDASGESVLTSSSRSEKKSTDACKSHKEAERRRRQRINAHLSTLRTLLPTCTKTDKASLLAEVVHHVKELRKQAAHVATTTQDRDSCCSEPPEKYWPFPGECDETILSYCGDGQDKTIMRVSVCCEDRPGLNRDLSQAIRLVKARAVKAEMMTVGGRTRSVVVLQWGSDGAGEEDIGVLRRALKAVVENRVSGSGLGQVVHGNKRVRDYDLVNGVD